MEEPLGLEAPTSGFREAAKSRVTLPLTIAAALSPNAVTQAGPANLLSQAKHKHCSGSQVALPRSFSLAPAGFPAVGGKLHSGKDFSPPLQSLKINPWQEGFATLPAKANPLVAGQGRTDGSGATQTCCWRG